MIERFTKYVRWLFVAGISSSCASPEARKSTETNWLVCTSELDCAPFPGASCVGGVCVDDAGRKVLRAVSAVTTELPDAACVPGPDSAVAHINPDGAPVGPLPQRFSCKCAPRTLVGNEPDFRQVRASARGCVLPTDQNGSVPVFSDCGLWYAVASYGIDSGCTDYYDKQTGKPAGSYCDGRRATCEAYQSAFVGPLIDCTPMDPPCPTDGSAD